MVRDGYKITEVGVIPEDWEVKFLPEVVNFIHGKAHEGNISEIGKFTVVNSKFISTGGIALKRTSNNFQPAKNGDVLMVLSDLPNGKALAKCFLVEEDDKYAVNQRICIYRPKGNNSKYLKYTLNRNSYFLDFDDGVNQTNIKNGHIEKCQIPLPPTRTEQTAIATALSDADALLSALDGLVAKKEAFKRGMMEGLLSGEIRLDGFLGEWATKKLSEIGKLDKGKGIRKTDTIEKGIPCIRYAELYTLHGEVIHEFHSHIPKEVAATSRRLKPGEILFTCSGETKADIGKSAAFCLDVEAYGGSDMIILSLHEGCDPTFMGYATNGPKVVKQKSAAGQGDAVVHISTSALGEVEISLPPLPEQVAIATLLSDLDAELSALRARRKKLGLVKGGMMEVLLSGGVRLV
jgi:type I restriction enzyme S subunit